MNNNYVKSYNTRSNPMYLSINSQPTNIEEAQKKQENNNGFSSDSFSEFDAEDDSGEDELYNIKDPFENLNRKSFAFTMWLDDAVIKHVDKVYLYITPKPVRVGLVNAAANFNEPTNAANHLLQFKFVSFIKVSLRFALNTTLGFFGAVDVASTLNLYPNPNDLGYTLTYYHVGNGFYMFVPVLGPYTLQSALSDLTSSFLYGEAINTTINNSYLWAFLAQSSGRAVAYLENRQSFTSLIDNSADSYSLVKSAFIQNRVFNAKRLKNSW